MLGLKLAFEFCSSDIIIYSEEKGIIINEPAVMVIDKYSGKLISIGKKAAEMAGKLPESMKAIYPIKDGIIRDFENACILLKKYIDYICAAKLFKPNILVSLPGGVTDLDKKTVYDAVMASGAGKVYFTKNTIASAFGFGVYVNEPSGCFVCDIEDEMIDCAVISMGDIVIENTAMIGSNKFNDSIKEYILNEYNIIAGKATIKEIKNTLCSAVIRNDEIAMQICGKSSEDGTIKIIEINSTEIYWLLKNQMDEMIACIKGVLENTPPELSADLCTNGIFLSGKGSDVYGLQNFIEWETGLKVKVTDTPELTAINGMAVLLKDSGYLSENCDMVTEKLIQG